MIRTLIVILVNAIIVFLPKESVELRWALTGLIGGMLLDMIISNIHDWITKPKPPKPQKERAQAEAGIVCPRCGGEYSVRESVVEQPSYGDDFRKIVRYRCAGCGCLHDRASS